MAQWDHLTYYPRFSPTLYSTKAIGHTIINITDTCLKFDDRAPKRLTNTDSNTLWQEGSPLSLSAKSFHSIPSHSRRTICFPRTPIKTAASAERGRRIKSEGPRNDETYFAIHCPFRKVLSGGDTTSL